MKSEHVEQCEVIQWCNLKVRQGFIELKYIFAIPNGGFRNITTATRLRAEGVKSGVPDLMLPVPRNSCHGLFIEMKKEKGGSLSDTQFDWRDFLKDQGYQCIKCNGSAMAISVIKDYMDIK